MADNVEITAGEGTPIATDDVSGAQYQRIKLDLGGDGLASPLVRGSQTAANSIPVVLATDDPATVSLALLDDAVVADDAAVGSTKAVMSGFRFDDSSPDNLDEGDAGHARMSARREIYTQVRDAGGNERGLNVDVNGNIGIGSIFPGAGSTHLGKSEDAVHSSGDVGVMVLAIRNDGGSTLADTTGDYIPLSTDSTGALRVTTGSGGTAMADDAAVTIATTPFTPAGGVYKSTRDSVDDGDGGIFHMTIKRSQYVTMDTPLGDSMVDDTLDALNVKVVGGSIAGVADDAAVTVATTEVLMAGFMADETATDSVNEGDGGMARMTLDRKQIVSSYAHAAGGATPGRLVSAASTNGTVIKASAATLYSLVAMNLNAAVRYLKVYNSTSVTVGTTTPTWTFPIPASTTGAGFNVPIPGCGIAFGTGLCLALTTGIADSDTGAVAANEICVNYSYL